MSAITICAECDHCKATAHNKPGSAPYHPVKTEINMDTAEIGPPDLRIKNQYLPEEDS
jgi:hypothetical protein